MNPEKDYDSEISEIKKIVLDNNKIVKGLQKKARRDTIFGVLKVIIIIGLAVGIFAFLKPYYDNVLNVYSDFTGTVDSMNEVKDGMSFSNFFNFFEKEE